MNKKYHPISEIIVCHSCENRNPVLNGSLLSQSLHRTCRLDPTTGYGGRVLDSRWSLPRTCRSDPLRRPASGYGAGMTTYAYFKHRIAQFNLVKSIIKDGSIINH